MKASYGNWINPTTIKTSIVNEADLWLIKDRAIHQKTKTGDITATAIVRNITKYENSQATIAELTIDEISGEFTDDKVINFNTGSTIFEESTYSMISGMSAITQGSGYKPGEKIKVITSTGGTDAIGEIVTVNNNGGIIGIDIINSGLAYRITDDITFDINTLRGVSAGLTASVDVVTKYPGYYFNTHGHPSSNKKLFDNYYYQDFSYEIRTDMAIKTYKNAVLDLIHPAGTKLFNQVLIKNTNTVISKYRTQAKPFEISILGHYTPYTWNTTENLRHNTQGIDLYPFGHNPSNGYPATAVDAIDTTGYVASDADASFTISIPTSAGGLGGTAITILLDEDKDDVTQASAAANTITIGTFDASETDAMAASFLINAINAVTAGRFIYASSGNGEASDDIGITAKQGSSNM